MAASSAVPSFYTLKERRLIAAQIHVSAALSLAAFLLCRAGGQLAAGGRWELQPIMVVAAIVALVSAVLPWVTSTLSPARQRAGIWQALVLAVIPAGATVHAIDFSAVGPAGSCSWPGSWPSSVPAAASWSGCGRRRDRRSSSPFSTSSIRWSEDGPGFEGCSSQSGAERAATPAVGSRRARSPG